MTSPVPRRRGALVVGSFVAAALLAAVVLWVVGDRDAASLLKSIAATAGAAAVLLVGRDRPVLAVAIVFVLASASRLVVETPVGTLRLEQPAIAALVVVAAVRVRRDGFHAPRLAWLVGAAVLLYLAVLALSSALVAPQPIASLRMTLWWAISVAGGTAAFILLRGRVAAGRDAFVLVGTGFAVVGIMAAVIFGVAGPDVAPGIQESNTVQPRVYGLGWETNLYASYLAAVLLLAVGAANRRRGVMLGALVLVGIALPLGATRGAYLGLAAGALSMVAMLGWRAYRGTFKVDGSLISTVVVAIIAVSMGVGSVASLLPNNDERLAHEEAIARPSPTPIVTPAPIETPTVTPAPIETPTVTQAPIETPAPTMLETASPRPTLTPAYDTIGFRLARVGPALDDFRQSPLIGLGASSFGQRHADASQGGAPDHLPILVLAVPYESGVIGVLALGLALVLVLGGLLRRASAPRPILAASLVAAITSLLVAYQATNALHFAANWLLLGLAAAVAWDKGPDSQGAA